MNYKFIESLKEDKSYPSRRLYGEISYALEVSEAKEGKYDEIISVAVDEACSAKKRNGALTLTDVRKLEKSLESMADDCKSYELLLVAHAHIDMDWMWSHDETVATTLSTFDVMLTLMREYPEFTFSQSQASCYEIVEKYAPDMLSAIRRRVAEGRWEVTASQWVEGDKNLASGEDLTRHIIEATEYLGKLFGLPKYKFNLLFEPDTFGHNANLPEILANGGIKYMYHCRGKEATDPLYRWVAPSGKSVVVFHEPEWYLGTVDEKYFLNNVKRMERYGLKKFLCVYGVGNHGGGATRMDLNRIEDMKKWPLMPTLKFSSYAEFFDYVESVNPELPEVKGELNRIFTGCYTSQSRIKKANSVDGRLLTETERIMSAAKIYGAAEASDFKLERAWRKHLFNQFHDILPGSCVTESREYAMANSMECKAAVGAERTAALKAIASEINLPPLKNGREFDDGFAVGAGTGVNPQSGVYTAETSASAVRYFLLSNPSSVTDVFVVDIKLWDYRGNLDFLSVTDTDGNPVEFELGERNEWSYWHLCTDLTVSLELPALGYKVIKIADDNERRITQGSRGDVRRNSDLPYVLEDEFARAEFSDKTCALVRFVDKRTGKEYSDENGLAAFHYIEEDGENGMSSWVQGHRYYDRPIVERVSFRDNKWNTLFKPYGIRKSFTFEASFGQRSSMRCTMELERGVLKYVTRVDFREFGEHAKTTPGLTFEISKPFKQYLYDIPYAVIERAPFDGDNPALSFIYGCDGDQSGLMLLCEGKNGYLGGDESMGVTLIRASADPDRTPEIGKHEFSVIICPVEHKNNRTLLETAEKLRTVIPVVSVKGNAKGTLPASAAPLIFGGAMLAAVKPSRRYSGITLRFIETEGKQATAFAAVKGAQAAYILDGREDIVEKIDVDDGGKAQVKLQPYSVVTLGIEI